MVHLDADHLEAYERDDLDQNEAEAVEQHLLLCTLCADHVEELQREVRLMQSALLLLEREGSRAKTLCHQLWPIGRRFKKILASSKR